MENIWAPWRSQYIVESCTRPAQDASCFLCRGLAEDPSRDRQNLLVWRGPASAVFLNRYPYNNGHLLIAPLEHQGDLVLLKGRSLQEPIEVIQRCMRALGATLRPHGFNVGLNLGDAAGAGLPGHLHWHIVPRWNGDTNFMPVLAETKVIVESLDAFYDRFKKTLELQL